MFPENACCQFWIGAVILDADAPATIPIKTGARAPIVPERDFVAVIIIIPHRLVDVVSCIIVIFFCREDVSASCHNTVVPVIYHRHRVGLC